jgi:hypothetical protein
LRRVAIPPTVDCPHCREKNPASEDHCASCGKLLAIYIGPAETLPRRLGLGSLMLLVALVALCLVVMREEPALGVFMLLVSVPALIRTFAVVATRKADGRPMVVPEKVGTFAASAGIVWLIGLAAALAFGAVCFVLSVVWMLFTAVSPNGLPPVFFAWDWSPVIILPLGGLAALAVIYYLGRILWVVKG